MHPDEVVDIAIQDLRSHLPHHAHAPTPGDAVPYAAPRRREPGLLHALWSRYTAGWSWYVRSGLTPPATEPYPLAARDTVPVTPAVIELGLAPDQPAATLPIAAAPVARRAS